ncbi:cation:proton antiporter [Compostimonas suwonensis]|uniref:CPA2 family monovalent cation:H+ antiporter-2 n=1 Tax=Compostimonas suwonensis TaxID=1048394 RepID=A0A2M9C3K5_9MICO|nr:cation:proton antiporter [Compostimonas suwonensis]PJJ65059.1 CPA2 family monovalent cation:H+ antiporter-2 [Compostimonas suwonensis]
MRDSTLLLIEVGALLLGLGLLARLANRIGISPIPFYLIVGLVLGQGGFLPLDASEEFFAVGSEIGVILLLVMLGLEYSPSELVTSLRQSRVSGLLDLVLNALPGAAFALLLGWGPIAAVALGGITWVSSSGVIAKVLSDLRRLGNRETPTILSILVIEDLAMAFYLPVLSALVIGAGVLAGATALVVAVVVVLVILYGALRHGRVISKLFDAHHPESLLLGVLGLTMLIAGIAQQVNVSAAVGAFLVGIALSGRVAYNAEQLLSPVRDLFAAVFFVFFGLSTDPAGIVPVLVPAILLALVTMATKTLTGYRAAARAGIGVPGRWRAGFALIPRGEFSIVIAGLAVGAGIEPQLAPLATSYVLITIICGPLLARMTDAGWFRRAIGRRRSSVDPTPIA